MRSSPCFFRLRFRKSTRPRAWEHGARPPRPGSRLRAASRFTFDATRRVGPPLGPRPIRRVRGSGVSTGVGFRSVGSGFARLSFLQVVRRWSGPATRPGYRVPYLRAISALSRLSADPMFRTPTGRGHGTAAAPGRRRARRDATAPHTQVTAPTCSTARGARCRGRCGVPGTRARRARTMTIHDPTDPENRGI